VNSPRRVRLLRAWRAGLLPVALFLLAATAPAAGPDAPAVTPPPSAFFDLVEARDRQVAREFYQKYIDVRGMPVVAAGPVADEALQRVHWIVTHLLAGRPDVLGAMVSNRMYLIIIGRDQVYTDMPEYRHHPNPAYQNERVRGTGGRPTSFGEENLLSLPLDRYDDESIAVHEFCHTVDGTLRSLDPGWTERRNGVFRQAVAKGLWKGTYAGSNPGEFWAEICQCYFDCNRVNNWNHGPIGTREQLRAYDPESCELARAAFNLAPGQDWRYRWLQPLPNVTPPPAKFHFDPSYTKFTWAREFPILGRRAGDPALLRANDIVRKLFAYRHDILKALIVDGVRLVVLGREEQLADLPEFGAAGVPAGVDRLARVVEYSAENKVLVVPEENVIGDVRAPWVGDCQVIRVLAKAAYWVTGTRPVDPNWEKRGRDVQQYELRVQRLDSRFGDKLRQLHQDALARGSWKGSAAAHDPAQYWAVGVLAYFDALGQDGTPEGATHPVATREALQAYDPALFQLVNETMAYDGHVDWRWRPAPAL
jgi:hypothetical protein